MEGVINMLIKISERYSIDSTEKQYEDQLPEMNDTEYKIWYILILH